MPSEKNIGKPYAGEPHVRFDEGGQMMWTMARLLRHRQTKGAETDMLGLRKTEVCFLLYPFTGFFYRLPFLPFLLEFRWGYWMGEVIALISAAHDAKALDLATSSPVARAAGWYCASND